ncbi:LysR family transcriptional regulator [Amphritea pacifica]|uniref:LysR family transcriptional regulator n=1 Tax=Amphritea pacifica TaxID=2811233 RepID=A0ABS2WD82_9GAMM|nr:LysR family transcriptional regulator [Amphritea pacifica]MBN0989472.1 LysR family transcriptional regulator [Amphritea pacifica]MBN1008831.1 LysR family transcriptional regulator [Amphritea pacifica]
MRKNEQYALMYEMAVFVEVVNRGSFTAAAEALGSSTSSVSRSVTKLENQLSTNLLQRTTRKLRLTSSGEQVYTRCKQMVEGAELVLDICDSLKQEIEGDISISVPKAVGSTVIHPLMPEFLQRYPKVNVQMILDDRALDLIDNGINLALRITDQPPPGLMGRELFRLDHVICASMEYLQQHGLPEHPKELKDHSCIYLGNNPADSRWRLKKDGQIIDIDVRGRYAANHTQVRLDAVKQGIGIGTLPDFTARPDLEAGNIIQLFPDWEFITNYQGGVWVLYPPTRHLPQRLKVLVDFLKEKLLNPSVS